MRSKKREEIDQTNALIEKTALRLHRDMLNRSNLVPGQIKNPAVAAGDALDHAQAIVRAIVNARLT